MCVYIYAHTHSFSYIIFHHGLSQETGYIYLGYTSGPHCLSILNVIVCIYESQTPSPPHSLPFPLTSFDFDFCLVGEHKRICLGEHSFKIIN